MIAGLKLYRENVRKHIYPLKKTPTTTPVLKELSLILDRWEHELVTRCKVLAKEHTLPKGPAYYCALLLLAVKAELYRMSGTFNLSIMFLIPSSLLYPSF